MVNWKYGEMWKWYLEHGGSMADPVCNIIVRAYDADYDVIKFRNQSGRSEPFVTRGFQAYKVRDDDPMVSAHSGEGGRVRHGLYFVFERKNLFVVFPRMIRDVVVADHFSFSRVTGDRESQVHLHLARYSPDYDLPGQGTVSHLDNYLPTSLDAVPEDLEGFRDRVVNNQSILLWSSILHGVMLRPFTHRDVAATAAAGKKKGSGSAQHSRHRRAAAAAAAAAAEPFDERTPFEQVWFRLPIQRLVIFGIPDGAMHRFTVCIYDRMSHPHNSGFKGLHFSLPSEAAHDEAQVASAIARGLEHHRWEDFIDPKEDEVA
jgi:hypothetical protein